jgi:hypothetical protein
MASRRVLARPQATGYGVRGAISFSKFATWTPACALRRDLGDGTWERRHGHLALRSELDLGYRLVVARRGAQSA